MSRVLRMLGLVAGAIALLLALAGIIFRPRVHRVVTPSGRAYDLLTDLVSSDGQYFMRYVSPSSDPDQLELGALDLLALVTSDPRARTLRIVTIEANIDWGCRPFTIYVGQGYVFERRNDKWIGGDERAIHDSMVGIGAAEAGASTR